MGFGLLGLWFVVNEPPVEEGVIDEGLQDSHQRVLVPAEHIHRGLACASVGSLDASYLHGIDQHPCESEGNFFGELFSCHCHFEAVAEVNVKDLARVSVEQKIGRVTVTK